VGFLEFSNKQKFLLIQILSKQWEKESLCVFNISMKGKDEKGHYFTKEWNNAHQKVIDIEDMIDLIGDKRSKKVYFETIKKSFAIQIEKDYHKIMDNK